MTSTTDVRQPDRRVRVNDTGRLVGFGVALIAALGLGFALGSAVGPLDPGGDRMTVDQTGPAGPDDHGANQTEMGE